MDNLGLQARLRDLKAAEMAALRLGDEVVAKRRREKQFAVRHQWTALQAVLLSHLENKDCNDPQSYEGEEGHDHPEVSCALEEGVKGEDCDFQLCSGMEQEPGSHGEGSNDNEESGGTKEDYSGTESGETGEEEFSTEGEEEKPISTAGSKSQGQREKKPCPVPNCNAAVVHLPKHLRNVHKWHAEYARTALSRFKLRKKYKFTSQEAASAGNRKGKKSEEKKTKKPKRKSRICPLLGCMVITERLPQHLQRIHKLKREDPKYKKYLSLAKVVSTDKPHVFMRMKDQMGRIQRPTPEFVVSGQEVEEICDNSEDGCPLNVQRYDCDEKQDEFDVSPPEDESAEMTESAEMASSVARNNSETETKVLNQFYNWMLSPDGEQKDRKTATQHVAQVKRIIAILGEGLECLLYKTQIRDVFLPHAEERYHPATIKSYLMSLQHLCSFLLEDNPSDVNFDKDSISTLREKLKKWSASYKRDTTKRRWERQEEDVSALITPETVKVFEPGYTRCRCSSGEIVWKTQYGNYTG